MYTKHARPNQRRNYSNNNFHGGGNRNRSSNRGPRKQYIDPAKFVKSAKPVNQVEVEPENLFADFDLDHSIKANIERKKFVKPSPIQDQTIKHALLGKDIIGIADTGTGKTAAFALPIIQKLITDRNSSAIVIAPTRELAQQIEVEFHDFAIGLNVRSAVLIGGQPMYKQIRQLSARPRLIIGTPGRIKDHIERRNINLATINILVLDEVDRMLDMGFLPDISEILAGLPKQRQSFFFSATIDHKIDGLINGFLIDPVRVSVKTGSTSDNVAS